MKRQKFKTKHPVLFIILAKLIIVTAILSPAINAEDYLSKSETALIGVGSVGIFLLGEQALKFDSTKSPLIKGPLPFELKLQKFLGGDCQADKSNFLDNTRGSAFTPVWINILMITADLSWVQGDRSKTTLQDQYLFTTGLVATKGVTSFFKGLVARERPLLCFDAAERQNVDFHYDRQSFFSGHASSSFFAATFVNKRLRSIMRSQLSIEEYKEWRWAPPALLFTWSSFVGWSRIQAYKHYISDVLAGALAGYLMAELFYSFGDDLYSQFDKSSGNSSYTAGKRSSMLFQIQFKF